MAAMNGSVKVGYGTEFAEQLLMEIVQESLGQQSAKTKKNGARFGLPLAVHQRNGPRHW